MGKYAILLVSAMIFALVTYSFAVRNSVHLANTRSIQSYSQNQAYNIAQSAMMIVMKDIMTGAGNFPIPSAGDTTGSSQYQPWTDLKGEYRIMITRDAISDTLLVQASGRFENASYTVSAGLFPKQQPGGGFPWPPFDNAIHTEGDLSFGNGTVHGDVYIGGKFSIPGNATINGSATVVDTDLHEVVNIASGTLNGSLYANTTRPGSIKFSNWGADITGDLYVGPGGDPELVAPKISPWHPGHVAGTSGSLSALIPKQSMPEIEFPDFPQTGMTSSDISLSGNTNGTLDLTFGDLFINEVQVRSNTQLTINVGNSTRTLRVNRLDIQQGHLNIISEGNGSLQIVVEDYFNLGGSSSLNNNNNPNGKERSPKSLLIAYSGQNEFKLAGNQTVNANFFIESADADFRGSSTFNGNIISLGSNISYSGAAQNNARVLFAPNAHVTITGSGSIVGSVIAKSLHGQGNATITHSDEFIDTLPDLDDNVSGGGSSSSASYDIAFWN